MAVSIHGQQIVLVSILMQCYCDAGYFDAPQARACPLTWHPPPSTLKPVTLVFCAIDGYNAMKVSMTL